MGGNPHCGSPLNWRDTASMTWEGRQLVSHKNLADTLWTSYSYNSEGIRTYKRVSDVTSSTIHHIYNYTLDGTKILAQHYRNNKTKEDSYLYFLYDESGSVIGFNDGTDTYYYQKNIQGDIIRILDVNGNVVTEYTYDAWGKILSVTGTLADTIGQKNPFRYRSYYYDWETGWYYLNSRYYDPEVGRFINADGIVGANDGIQGYNLFAYCNNNPVILNDPTGQSAQFHAMPKCPEEILAQIGEPDGTYGGSYEDGDYTVYAFNDLHAYTRSGLFGESKKEYFAGKITRYYFKITDYQAVAERYMKKYRALTFTSNIMNVSDGSDYFNNCTILVSLPLIGVFHVEVATVLAYVGLAQVFIVDPLAEYCRDRAEYYFNKPNEIKLEFIVEEYYLASILWRKKTKYV